MAPKHAPQIFVEEGERAAASESRTLIEPQGVVDLEEVAKILVTQRLRL